MAPFNLIQALCLTFCFVSILSFAPEDVSQYCIDNALVPDYPETVKPLMDSWSYQYLLTEDDAVWLSINLDQYPESWTSTETGESCSNSVSVQEPSNVPQDNWLITQHITKAITQQSILYPTLIYVNLTYKIQSDNCPICNSAFQLLLYNTDSSLGDIANLTSNFTLLANLTNNGDLSTTTMFTKTLVNEPDQEGFYLALKDYGTNVTVSRFLVYRLIGPAKQVGLTLFPETPAPITNPVTVSGVCVANANTTDGELPVLNLDPNGSWSTSDDQCFCIEGHQLISLEGSSQCQACTPGTYKSLKDNSDCLTCPDNSASTVHGATICSCEENYYRAPFETAEEKCTVPPGTPSNIIISNLTNTTVHLSWTAPTFLGGRTDLYYNIFASTNAETVQLNNAPVLTTSYHATGLSPDTSYGIIVTSENGVSMFAGNGITTRSTYIFLRTSVGVPPQVTGVYIRAIDDIVEWLPTDSSNGMINMYEVQLFSSEAYGIINIVDSSMVLYKVNDTTDYPITGQPVNVRVRAITDAGPGQWSEPELYAAINPIAPTSLSTTVSSTVMNTMISSTNTNTNPSVTSMDNTIPSSSLPSSSSSTSSSSTNTKSSSTSNSATPTTTDETTNPIIAIVGVVVGAILILIIVAIGAVLYFIFRLIRLKHEKRKEDIDYAPLVHFNAASTADSEDEIKVELKQ